MIRNTIIGIVVLFSGALLICTAWATAIRWCKTGLAGGEDRGDVLAVAVTLGLGAIFAAFGAHLIIGSIYVDMLRLR